MFTQERNESPATAARRIAVREQAGIHQMYWASDPDHDAPSPSKPRFDAIRLGKKSILVFHLGKNFGKVMAPDCAHDVQAQIKRDALNLVLSWLPESLANEWRRRNG